MKNKDIIKTLQKEIEIPDIVQKKADAAFAASVFNFSEMKNAGC